MAYAKPISSSTWWPLMLLFRKQPFFDAFRGYGHIFPVDVQTKSRHLVMVYPLFSSLAAFIGRVDIPCW